MSVRYAISVHPSAALLGEPLTIELSCRALADSPEALTFGHASLTVLLTRIDPSGAPAGEPEHVFPNRRVVHKNGTLRRVSASGGIERLAASDERSRSLSSTSVFATQLLDVGDFDLSFTLASPPRHFAAGPARVRITSGPGAVPLLLDRLESTDAEVRARAASLLRRMTGHGLEYDPEADDPTRAAAAAALRAWWSETGEALPWSRTSDGATFQVDTAQAVIQPVARPGGVVLPKAALSPEDHEALVAALRAFRDDPGAESLGGERLVADRRVAYPKDPAVVEPTEALAGELSATVDRLSELAIAGEDHAGEARVILATIARMPSSVLSPALTKLEVSTLVSPPWSAARPLVLGLLDWLAPGRS